MNRGESDLATDWEALPTGAIARGYLIKQPERTELRQLKLGRLFAWPADQPRHAIRTSSIRSIPLRPRKWAEANDGGTTLPSVAPAFIIRNRIACIGHAGKKPEFPRKKSVFSVKRHPVAGILENPGAPARPHPSPVAPHRNLTLLS